MDWLMKSLDTAVQSGSMLVKAVEQKIEHLDASVKELVQDLEEPNEVEAKIEDFDLEEYKYLKITEELKIQIQILIRNPKHFLTRNPAAIPGKERALTAHEQFHATLILQEVPELSKFRYAMTPSHVSEDVFWHIYFLHLAEFALPEAIEILEQPAEFPPAETKPRSAPRHKGNKKAKKMAPEEPLRDTLPKQEVDFVEEFLEIKKPYLGELEEESYFTDFSFVSHYNKAVAV